MINSGKKYNQFQAMFAIAKASFRSITRSPSAVIFSIGFPLIFIIVFGFINGNRIQLDVGLHPLSDTNTVIFKSFSNAGNVHIEKNSSEELMQQRLISGRIDAIILFTHSKVELITSKASREKASFVNSLLTNLIDKQNLSKLDSINSILKRHSAEIKFDESDIVELKETLVQGREYKTIDFILPGQLGFSILSAGVFGTAFVFFSLRQTLVLKRFFATPVKRIYIVLGEAASRLLFQMIGSLVILIIGKYVFDFTLIHGFYTVLQMLILSAMGLLIFMGFGFVVSGIAKSESVIPPIANIITLPQFLLSGTFFPVDAFPNWLQCVSKILPLTYLNDALRKVAFEGASFAEISNQLLIMGIWGVCVYAAAVKLFRWE